MNLLAYLVLILFSVSAGAANHYIRAGATGTGSGDDWTNAYTTWPTSFTRGDTYYIASGSYAGKVLTTAHSGTTRIVIKKATTGDHGTETGWSASYATGQVAFTSGLEFRTGYWTIDGVTGGGPGSWSTNLGMKITETRDSEALIKVGNPTLAGTTGWDTAPSVVVSHVEMQGKGSVSVNGGSYSNDGVANYGNDGFTLSYYWMYGIGRCPFYSSGRNLIAEYGWVQSFYGSIGVHSEIASVWGFYPVGVTPIGSHTFRYNLFTHIWSTGGLMWDGADNASAYFNVYGNTFYKPSGATWEVANGLIGGWSARNFRNARVFNNTFINVNQNSLGNLSTTYSNNYAYNNIFYNSTAPSFSVYAGHDYDYFINSGTVQGEVNGTTGTANPFTDYINFDFTLTGATAAGTSLGSPFNVDGLGATRGADGVWDRGAYEFSAGGTDTTPPTRSAGAPSGSQAAGTTSVNLTLTTNEAATCKYGTVANTAYASIANTFLTTGSTSHSQTISGLSNGNTYTYYVRCQDVAGNANVDDYTITFSVASGGGALTPTYIQGAAYRNVASATTAAVTFSGNTTAGSAIVVLYGYSGVAASASCSDSQGNTYVVAVDQRDTTNDQNAGACYALNTIGGANTVTVTFTTARAWRYALASEYSNVAAASALDTSVWAINTSTTPTSTAVTTTTNGDLIWGGVLATSGTTTITAGTGFTRRLLAATEPTDAATEDLVQTTAGSIAADWTFGTSRKYVAILLALKPASGGLDPITGAASVAEAATTLSGSGVLTVAGGLSKAEQDDTEVGAAQVPISGVFAGADADFSLDASGFVLSGLSAGLLISEQADSLYPDGIAILGLSASAALLEADHTLNFTALVAQGSPTPSGETTTAKYCVRADGTAVAPIDTNGVGTDPTQCMPLSVANVQTYKPGATIYLFAAGGTFTTPLSNTPTPCTGLAYSIGREGYPITFVGVPDSRNNPPVIDGAGLSTPQVCVGDYADYVNITGVDVWGSKSTATPSVRIGASAGSAGSSYTVQVNSVRVLGNNRNSASGDHSCFEVAGSGSSVSFSGVTGTGCLRATGETATGVSAGLAVYGTSRATISNSSASLSGQCLYAAETGQIVGSSVFCSQILYSGVRHSGDAITTCDNCSFDFGAAYTTSGGAGFFGSDSSVSSSIALTQPTINVRSNVAARVSYGSVSMSRGSILVDSPYFEWKPAGQVTLSGMQNRLRTTVATPKHFYSAQAGSTSIFNSNTWTYEDRSSIRRAVPFYISGALTATKDSHIGCSRLYGSPTAAIIYGVTGNLSLSGVTCR